MNEPTEGRREAQWPCRVPVSMSEQLEIIRKEQQNTKTGVICYLLELGIDTWTHQQKDLDSWRKMRANGLILEKILPFLGDGIEKRASRR